MKISAQASKTQLTITVESERRFQAILIVLQQQTYVYICAWNIIRGANVTSINLKEYATLKWQDKVQLYNTDNGSFVLEKRIIEILGAKKG